MRDKKFLMRRYDLTGGMDSSTNPFLMSDSKYAYLLNVNHDEQGSFSKDGGYTKFLDEIGTGVVDDMVFL